MMKFESGYTVETVFDGSKLGIEPFSVEVLPGGELLILDSVNSNIYRISLPLSRCELVTFIFVISYGYFSFYSKIMQAVVHVVKFCVSFYFFSCFLGPAVAEFQRGILIL